MNLCRLFRTSALGLLLSGTPLMAAESGPPAPLRMEPRLPDGTPSDIADLLSRPVDSLADALRRAYWSNPGLLSQRATARSIDYRVPQARSQYGPRLEYSASYGWQRDNFEQPLGWVARKGWSSTATAVLTQPVYTFGRTAAAERTALGQVAFQHNALRANEQQAMLDAITAYVGLRRDRMGVTIAADNLALLERELADSRERLRAREITSTDLQQVQTRVELGRAQLLSAHGAAANSEAVFLRMVGSPAAELAEPPSLDLPVTDLEQAYAYGELHDPVLAAAQARERISRAVRDGARADLMPRVELRGKAEVGAVTPYTDAFRQTELRGEVVVSGPIFESGQRQARLSEAEAANDADWRLIDASLRENRADIASAWNDWQAQTASIERLAASVESARAAYDGALIQERAGLRTTLDVLDLARELLSARSNHNAAVASAYLAKARLLAALGLLDGASLLPNEPRYDAEVHFQKVRNDADVPLITPLVRALDSLPARNGKDRPLRDPAAPLTTPAVSLPVLGDK